MKQPEGIESRVNAIRRSYMKDDKHKSSIPEALIQQIH
jgi:hypothetical protein